MLRRCCVMQQLFTEAVGLDGERCQLVRPGWPGVIRRYRSGSSSAHDSHCIYLNVQQASFRSYVT